MWWILHYYMLAVPRVDCSSMNVQHQGVCVHVCSNVVVQHVGSFMTIRDIGVL